MESESLRIFPEHPRGEVEGEIQLTLFVGSIGSEATQESLTAYFAAFGKVSKVKVIYDWATKQSKECALVYFTSHESFCRALRQPKQVIGGKTVRVEVADRSKKGTRVVESSVMQVAGISNLTPHGEVIEYFSTFGQITSCRFSKETSQSNTKIAFVRFEKPVSIERVLSISKVHFVGGKKVLCSLYRNTGEREQQGTLPSSGCYFQDSHTTATPDTQLWLQGETRNPLKFMDQLLTEASLQEIDGGCNASALMPAPQIYWSTQPACNCGVSTSTVSLTQYSSVKCCHCPSRFFVFPHEYEKDPLFAIFCGEAKQPTLVSKANV